MLLAPVAVAMVVLSPTPPHPNSQTAAVTSIVEGPESSMGLAVALAFASAAAIAVSASLQHRAASRVPAERTGLFSVMGYLLRQPMWLIGLPVSFMAISLHTLALKYGTLPTVQPVMVAGVVMAVVVRAGFERRLISRSELGGVTITALGLGGFLALAYSGDQPHWASHQDAVLPMGVALGLVVVLVGYRRWGRPPPRIEAYVMAVGAGLCFGTLDSLLKVLTDMQGEHDMAHAVWSWPVLALVVFGAGGVMFNQRAYQVAPISVAMPVVHVTNILVAVNFGWVLYGQPPSSSPTGVLAQATCLVVAGYGLRRIAVVTGHGAAAGAEPPRTMLNETMLTTDAVSVGAISAPPTTSVPDAGGCPVGLVLSMCAVIVGVILGALALVRFLF
jgi:hypothetical protein